MRENNGTPFYYNMPDGGGMGIANGTQGMKMMDVASRSGQNVNGAQMTERSIYDSLDLFTTTTTVTSFRFFEGLNARKYPLTNLSENKLSQQECMVVKYITLEHITITAATPPIAVTALAPLSTSFGGLYRSDLNVQIGQSIILKNFPMDDLKPEFNPWAQHTTHNVIALGVDLTIFPEIEFIAMLQAPPYTGIATAYLQLRFHGQGTLYSPRMTM